MNNGENNQRKISDVILELEEKINLLIQIVSSNDMNNKLILDRLNKLLQAAPTSQIVVQSNNAQRAPQEFVQANKQIINSVKPSLEISESQPNLSRRKTVKETEVKASDTNEIKNITQEEASASKIPVGQRVMDNNGKDVIMADVSVTNVKYGTTAKLKTNALGKWQAYLSPGKYLVNVSKIVNPETLARSESELEIEIKKDMKSLQLPPITIQR